MVVRMSFSVVVESAIMIVDQMSQVYILKCISQLRHLHFPPGLGP